jgi:hypothetical protein
MAEHLLCRVYLGGMQRAGERPRCQPTFSHATGRAQKHALRGVSDQDAGRDGADTASPQIVRKKSGRDQEKSATANDDNSAFTQVKGTFSTRTNTGQ